jgi:hypothetical protein
VAFRAWPRDSGGLRRVRKRVTAFASGGLVRRFDVCGMMCAGATRQVRGFHRHVICCGHNIEKRKAGGDAIRFNLIRIH